MAEVKEKKSEDIVLPSKPVKASAINPESMILFGLPKCGKTRTIMDEKTGLKNCLLIDVENGSNHYSGLKMQVPEGYGPVSTFNWLKKVAQTIKDSGKPYDYVAIDTLSYLDEISEWVGTYRYMQRPGNKFNMKDGVPLKPTDPNYESVHTVPEGYGYRWSREAMMDIFSQLKGLGKICTIFICHVADKYVLSKQTNQEVRVIDLSLTGKLRNIIARDVDAIGYVWNEDGQMQISFKGSEEKVGGIRGANHIQGYEGPLEWDKIFIKEK
jgi:hypothetical protein